MRMPLALGFAIGAPPLRSSASLLSFHVTASALILVPVGNTSRSPFQRTFQYHAFPRKKSVPWPLALRLTFFFFVVLAATILGSGVSADEAISAFMSNRKSVV